VEGGILAMKVFISYTWEDSEHIEWVEDLAARLRKDGIETTLDQWDIGLGDEPTKFMEEGVRNHERVLVICTPEYKRKADKRLGGAGYETRQMAAEILEGSANGKFIPVLRKGTRENAHPFYLGGIWGVDLREDDMARYEQEYRILLKDLSGRRKKAPPLGAPIHEGRFDEFKLSFLQDKLMGRAWKVGSDDLRYESGLLMNQERARSIVAQLKENAGFTGTKFWIKCLEGEEFERVIQENIWGNGDTVYKYSEAERWEVLNRCARGLAYRLERILGKNHIQYNVTDNGDICYRYIE